MKSSELDYELPPELIAQHPADRRDHRGCSSTTAPRTSAPPPVQRSSPARLRSPRRGQRHARRPGAAAPAARDGWRGRDPADRGARATRVGRASHDRRADCGSARCSARSRSWRSSTAVAGGSGSTAAPDGELPLPPYITEPLVDPDRYQTVYARHPGSAAAPTAGLHFTSELLSELDVARLTLHVGLDTFRPVRSTSSTTTSCTASATASPISTLERIPCRRRARGRDDHGPCAGDDLPRSRWRRRVGPSLMIQPGFEFQSGRRAADQLPPAAIDAARAGDGVRGCRGDEVGCTGWRSPSSTGSTRSAMRC